MFDTDVMHIFLLHEHNTTLFFPLTDRMDLAKRFEEATTTASVNISSLILNRPYRNVQAKKKNKKYGPTILLSLRDVDEKIVDIFLPQSYANFVMN